MDETILVHGHIEKPHPVCLDSDNELSSRAADAVEVVKSVEVVSSLAGPPGAGKHWETSMMRDCFWRNVDLTTARL